ncbi:MAG: MBL fold metallo-hydrolase [Candidatus Colwellbacteria bacterium]|nr:MBL fold metallo-hydrolase [Candidatus Colwellbacteria bacterium]
MKFLSLSFLALVGFNGIVWQGVMERVTEEPLRVHFLDVGQGDSQMIVFPDGVKVLIDGGPSKEILFELGEIISPTDRYIDLVMITHAQLDHYGGIRDVIQRYRIGAFIFNGEEGTGDVWDEFKKELQEKEIPIIVLGQGDRIRYGDKEINILSPTAELLARRDLNDGSLVAELAGEDVKILFTGDSGFEVEKFLLEKYDMNIDVLKVAHHGSRYSTGMDFLDEATPLISVIEVGKNNFGHPTEATLQRLSRLGSTIYRTDEDGRISLTIEDGRVGVKTELTN